MDAATLTRVTALLGNKAVLIDIQKHATKEANRIQRLARHTRALEAITDDAMVIDTDCPAYIKNRALAATKALCGETFSDQDRTDCLNLALKIERNRRRAEITTLNGENHLQPLRVTIHNRILKAMPTAEVTQVQIDQLVDPLFQERVDLKLLEYARNEELEAEREQVKKEAFDAKKRADEAVNQRTDKELAAFVAKVTLKSPIIAARSRSPSRGRSANSKKHGNSRKNTSNSHVSSSPARPNSRSRINKSVSFSPSTQGRASRRNNNKTRRSACFLTRKSRRHLRYTLKNTQFHDLTGLDLKRKFPILGLGLKYIPTCIDTKDDEVQMERFLRHCLLTDFFLDDPDPTFNPKIHIADSTFIPEHEDIQPSTSAFVHAQQTSFIYLKTFWPPRHGNLRVLASFKALRTWDRVVFTPSDKNLGLVALPTEQYHALAMAHLQDAAHYTRMNVPLQDLLPRLRARWNQVFFELQRRIGLNRRERKWLTKYRDVTLPKFHVLPKLHKQGALTARPIVGAPNWITTFSSIWLSTRLEHYNLRFTLKNSTELIRLLEGQELPETFTFVTMDVNSLYTNMKIELLKIAVAHVVGHDAFSNVIDFICYNNFFTYANQTYHQQDGIAMGTNAAVHLANFYLDELDHFIANLPAVFAYRRYIDDIILVIDGDNHSAQDQVNFITTYAWDRYELRFDTTMDNTNIDFLDVKINAVNTDNGRKRIEFCTHQKALNRYQYIPPFSNHVPHTFQGFIKGELIRYIRTNTSYTDYMVIRERFRNRLLARGYNSTFLQKVFATVSYNQRPQYLQPRPKANTERPIVPLVLRYSRRKGLPQFVARFKYHRDKFNPPLNPVLAWSSSPNIAQLVTRSSLDTFKLAYLAEKGLLT